TPFKKLRSNLLLFLQLLALVLITAALAQPHLYRTTIASGRWILALDSSASMQATDERPNRFEAAKRHLLDAVDSIPPQDEIMALSISGQATVRQSFTQNRSLIRQSLANLQPDDLGNSWQQTALILKSLLKERPVPHLILASDFAALPEGTFGGIAFDPIPVGKSDINLAITRANVLPQNDDPQNQVLFYQLSNFWSKPMEAKVQILLNDEVSDAYSETLQPLQKLDRTLKVSVLQDSKIEIRLNASDDLKVDNDFVLYAEAFRKIQVKIQNNDPFLKEALRAIPEVEPTTTATIVISDSGFSGPGIAFQKAPDTAPGGEVIEWNKAHPALRFVDAGLWQFTHCSPLDLPEGSVALLETGHGAACYASDRRGERNITCGFGLNQTNLVTFAGFPIFLQNSLRWISEGLREPLPTLTGNITPKKGPFEQAGRKGYLNFADAAESQIAPGKLSAQSAAVRQPARIYRNLSVYFLILLLGIIIVEWWAFHRRLDSK
ncbi:MAG TPA: VWA domain-containing protein, partial [Acidobacteriota bacterium]|nr:VWA domain-containing protein [Acidobacteriota bacterium]